MEYFLETEGIPFTFLNYHGAVAGNGSVQLVFFVVGDSLDPFKDEIAELMSGITID